MAAARPSLRPTLRLDVLDQLPTPQQEGDVRAHFAGGSWESQPPVGEPTGNAERRPRPSFRVSQGGSTLSMCHQSQEWAIGPHGVRRPDSASELPEQCRSADIMEFNVIGQGASSVVRKAVYLPGQCFVALKCISVHEKEKRLQLMNELRLLCDGSTAGVRGLIRYFGAYFSPESSAIKVALEYMDAGSLQSLLLRVGAFPEGILARIAADVLDGLAWLHSVKALVHRDIKPANILMNSAGEPKLSDFGTSTALDLDMAASTGGDALGRSVVQTIGRNGHSHHHAVAASSSAAPPSGRGTLYYMSPERLSSQPYGFSADIWSLGLTLLECATGIYPYATDTGPVSTMLEIMDCDPLTHHAGCAAQARARVSHSGQAFLRACLDRNPGGRPSASQARHAEWCSAAACSHAEVAAFLATPSSGVSGDAASQQMAYIQSLGQLFAAHYYCLLDAPRGDASSWHAQLGGIYAPHAHLTWLVDGHIPCQCAGPLDICAALAGARESSHHVGHLDCQPLLGRGASSGDGVLVHVTGTVVIAFEQFRFVEVFTLLPCAGGDPDTEGRWFVVNHWRREFAGA